MTQTIPYTHLHTHSPEGSLLDGFMRIDKAIEKVQSLGMDALGISDHGSMAAHEKFYTACKKAGIHPVLGMEGYLTYDKTYKKADFEAIDYIHDATGRHIFDFLTEDEAARDDHEWFLMTDLSNKEYKDLFNAEKKEGGSLYDIVLNESPDGVPPRTKAMVTRQLNAYIKTQEKNGRHFYVQADTSRRAFFDWFPRSSHLLMIALNNEGYQNLLKLNAIGYKEGFYRKPRIDYGDLQRYGKGLAGTSACLGGSIPQLILRGKQAEAKKEIQRLASYFDVFYLEVQPSRQPDQWTVNQQLIAWSEEMGLPLIATTDAHMVSRDEHDLHQAITNIGQGNATQTSDDEDISVYDSAYLMTQQEILDMGIPPEALQNAYDLSHQAQVDFLDHTETKFPEYNVPAGYTFDSYLRELAYQGLLERFMKKDYIEDYDGYQERLGYELDIISSKGLSAYFVIVWDYINAARERDIYVGPGRGSAAGSLVAYALQITNLDPIKYDLLFERFLNPERTSLPDIDTDFDYLRRDEVLDYIVDKYGEDHVAKIGTYTQMSSRLVLKDVARMYNIDHNKVNDWNKDLPVENGQVMPLEEAVEEIPTFQQAYRQYPDVFDLAIDIQGMPRGAGIHACGIQISPVPLDENIPVRMVKSKGEEEVVTQYEGGPLESLGFIKFDVLGLKYLSVIRIAADLVQEHHGIELDMDNLEPEDPATFAMIHAGHTYGIFQLSSVGMVEVFKGLEHVDFESLIAGIALYRPGPMQFIETYQDRANGLQPVRYPTPELKDILKNTYGIVLYQEQLMKITQVLGGYTLGQADKFRKAVSKKSQAVMDEELPKLKQGILDNGHDETVADEIIELIKPFVGYGFNKSHSAAYALIAYQTAYLKRHYPVEFFASIMTVFGEDKEKIAGYIEDAKWFDIQVKGPDVNESKEAFTIIDSQTIRYGFDAMKGFPDKAVQGVLREQPFTSVEDLMDRMPKSELNKTAVDTVAYSGALDSFYPEGTGRTDILKELYARRGDDAHIETIPTENTTKYLLEKEKELLGVYISGHPLDGIAQPVDWTEADNGERVKSHAVVTKIKRITTKKGDPMAFLTLEFLGRTIETPLFPSLYDKETIVHKDDQPTPIGLLLAEGMVVKVEGAYEMDNRGQWTFFLKQVTIPVKANRDHEAHIQDTQAQYEPAPPVAMPRFTPEEMQ